MWRREHLLKLEGCVVAKISYHCLMSLGIFVTLPVITWLLMTVEEMDGVLPLWLGRLVLLTMTTIALASLALLLLLMPLFFVFKLIDVDVWPQIFDRFRRLDAVGIEACLRTRQ